MAVSLAGVLEHLVKGITTLPEEVQVASRETAKGELLEVRVAPVDLGRVIGRGRAASCGNETGSETALRLK